MAIGRDRAALRRLHTLFDAKAELAKMDLHGKEVYAGKNLIAHYGCYACHDAHAAVEHTFVQFYPTLIPVAKAKGTFKTTP